MTMQNIHETFTLAFRLAVFLAIVILGSVFIIIGSQAALADNISLKGTSIISGDNIHLNDIFNGLPKNGDYVLGPAPAPGQDMILNARTLLRVALAMDLPWRPASTADQVTLRRAATLVKEDKVRGILEDGLREKGVTGRFDVNFQDDTPQFVLPPDMPESVEVSDLRFDPKRDWFEATLSAPSADHPLKQQIVTGTVRRIVEVPVLKDTLRGGDIIGPHDIDWIDVFTRDLQQDYILSDKDLIGMTPRRMVVAGRPVRAMEIEQPRIVARGDEITLVFHQGGIMLTAKGRASQDGAKGEIVRVVNTTSSRSVDGIVTGEREVTVQ